MLIFAKFLNMAYYDLLNRAFNPVTDWSEIAQAKGVLQDAIGAKLTNVVAVVLVIGLALLVAAITAAAIHLTAVAARHRRGTVRGLAALTAVWGLSAGLSLQLIPGSPLASASETGLAVARCAPPRRRSPTRASSGRPSTAPTPRPPSPPPTC